MFGAMAAVLVMALFVPEAFDDRALAFALAYGAVRWAQIALFVLASRDEPDLRHSVMTLAGSTAAGVGLIIGASFFDGPAQGVIWAVALLLDYGGPYFFGGEGWRLSPQHFAERHGLILIIALGESIVAIGAGVTGTVGVGEVAAAVFGITLVAMMWWIYFDVVALVAARRLASLEDRRERNAVARDSYSYLHFPMVAGIVLVALGLKKTIADVDAELDIEAAFALLGGFAIFLLALVAFRLRNVRSLNRRRCVVAILLFALLPLAVELPALATLALVAGIACALVAYEAIRFAEHRDRIRHVAPEMP
jgi:low temperature requirement protein LtrA